MAAQTDSPAEEQIFEESKNIIFIQSRAETNYTLVDEYAEMMQTGVKLDAAQGVRDKDGQVYVFDGLHRGEAARKVGLLLAVNVRPGTKQGAEWLSLTANQKHGLRRSRADRRRIVRLALQHPNGVELSNRAIARHCGVDHKTVGKTRQEMEASGEIPQIEKRIVSRNGATYQQNTGNIGGEMDVSGEIPQIEKQTDTGRETVPDERADGQEDETEQEEATHKTITRLQSFDAAPHSPHSGIFDLRSGTSQDRSVELTAPAQLTDSRLTYGGKLVTPALSQRTGASMAQSGKDGDEFATLVLSNSGANGYKLERQPHPCPRCDQDRIVGVNGSQRWCLHCEAQWRTQTEFLADCGGSESRRVQLQRRFLALPHELDNSQIEQAEAWLDSLERELTI